MGDQSVLGEATSAKSEVFPEELGNDENLPPNDDMVFEEVEKSRKNDGYEFLIAESRFDFWIKALMLRYWVDFGNQSKYRVNWLRKTHPLDENTIVEIIIHVSNVPGDASNADATDNPPLFSITILAIERKVEISQKYTLVWKNTEFPKLKSLVDRLQVNNELDADTIRDDYADIFQESEDAESLNLSSLDLSEILWDVSLLSTNENTTKSDQPKDKSIKVKSKVKGSNKVRVKLLSSPVCKKNTSKTKVPATPSAKVAKQQIININNIQQCAQRVSNLEKVVARIDKEAVNSDAKLSALSDTLFQSLANRVQNEMSILRKAFDEKVLQYGERTNKAELEVKKLKGRLGSLVEEKNQLEKSNKSLSDQVEELQNNTKDDAVQRESGRAVQNELSANVTDRNEPEVLITKEESGSIPTKKADPSESGDSNEQTVENQGGKKMIDQGSPEEYDFVFLCDSNRKFINTQLLCPNRTVKIIPCGTSSQAIKIMSSPRFQVNEALIINTGVNDVEHLTLDEVIQKQLEMIDTARKAFPGKKIIVSSVTPRDDDFDEDIRAINRAIQSEILNFNDVIYANNDNLRDRALYFDRKHLNRNRGVRKFAANIKKAIRMASGVVDNKPRYPSYHSGDPHPIRPDDRAPYPHPRYSPYHSDDPHPIRPEDRVPYPQHRYGSSVNPLLRPEDMRRKQDSIATQPIEVSKEHETKKENGINDVFSQLSTLNKLVNVLVSSNLQRCSMMYPQSTASPSFFPRYSSAVSQTSIP
ncbi:Hypothetical predicted protein [Paramuricea clavata]|uniref:Uncharacterized protein n=1 Tax=Paramuricea clavata TaxID=317549 RepID=A0A6S7G1X1_PARCT|nr:Hypothetical predicted protein [Paramuricea clavata]